MRGLARFFACLFLCVVGFVFFASKAVGQTTPAPLQPLVVCLPEIGLETWGQFKTGTIPAGVSSRYTHFAVWKSRSSCATGKGIQIQVYSLDQFAQFAAMSFASELDLNAWTAAQPLDSKQTDSELAFMIKTYWEFYDSLQPVWFVTPNTSGTRPYYKANAAGTAISTKLGNVAINTTCDGTKRLGTTNYYWVPSVGGYAVCSTI